MAPDRHQDRRRQETLTGLPFVNPPARMPFPWGWVLGLVERRLGKPLLANRILGWSPRTLAGSGLMEALVVHDDAEVPRRLLKLVRLFVSFRVSCPFCIDLNGHGYTDEGVTSEEVRALADGTFAHLASVTDQEKAALAYAACLTATPVRIPGAVVTAMNEHFSDKAFTILAATTAQVNFWARMIQGLGVQEAGFCEEATLFDLDRFRTRVP